ncbi:MAG: C40 family peptidase, partial [Nocardioidaceae bacterium]
PGHFDCSGLTKYAFKQADIKMPRTSDGQYHRVRHINKGQLKKGDLVFFYDGGGIYHVGMYWGKKNGHKRVLHASEPGDPVKIDKIWTSKYKAGTLRWRH